jgi:flagellin
MALQILNNIAALYAENNLTSTSASLQTTLQQLSSGSRINSGADDPAGLAISDGLGANEAALTQSSHNATDGIGLLQTADGALSQVTSLLDQAVTLATEAANGTLTTGQVSSANQEYQNILAQIGNIGSTTNFNSSNVFSASATNMVVTDGTASGLNTYADTVGILTTASIGTTAAGAITSAAVAPVTSAPALAIANTAGVYTLTPAASTDTLSGQLSFAVGATGTTQNLTIAAGTTLTALAQQLTANNSFTAGGLTASVASGVLTITGGTSGANAAANTVACNGTALLDNSAALTITPAAGVTGVPGTQTTSTLTFGGASPAAANGDGITGSLTYSVGSGAPTTFTLGSATTLNTAGLAAALNADATFHTTNGLTATVAGAVLTIKGPDGSSNGITLVNGFTDTTAGTPSYTPANNTSTGALGTAATETLSALATTTSIFSSGAGLSINGTSVSVAGLTGATAAAAITANSTLAAAGISAAFNAGTKVLTITGNAASGLALTVTPTGLTASTPQNGITQLVTATAATGSAASGGSSAITLGSNTDTVVGTLKVTVGTSGLAIDAPSLTIAANTTGSQLASQINESAAFTAAGITATYNANNFQVTLVGPAGAANTLSTAGTTLIDSSSSLPSAGANLTTSAVSILTALSATAILDTVTSAVTDVAYQRGTVGADINELTSASNVASSESVNLTSAQDSITATDYGQAASNLSKYQILSQTGISALAQANSVQQEVLKLLQ